MDTFSFFFRFFLQLLIAVFSYLAIFSSEVQAQIFTKVQSAEINTPRGRTFGAGWIDFNSDGYPDIWNNNYDTGCNLYINNKDGSFTLTTNKTTSSMGSYYSGITWGDFDNNGYDDLFLTTLQGGNSLFKNLGDGNFLSVAQSPVSTIPDIHLHSTLVDYDNDGWLDLFVPTCSSFNFAAGGGTVNYLYHNNCDGTFTKVENTNVTTASGNNQCANFADIDNDGDLDLFITEWQKDNWLFENNGDGTFTRISGTEVNTNNSVSMTCCWGDFDNDGFVDLYVGNGSGQTLKQKSLLYHNNGDKTFTKITTGDATNVEGNIWTTLTGDFDNDGDLDLFAGELDDTNKVFLNDGSGNFSKVKEFNINSNGTSGAGLADYDNDGFLDLFVANASGTGNSLYHNNGNSNKWLEVMCKGSISNLSAIGAKIKIKAIIFGKPVWQMREVNASMGFRSVSDLRIHFGLGDASVVDSLIIEWPSKEKTILTNIPANQLLNIKEEMPFGYLRPYFKADILAGYSPLKVQFTDNSLFSESNPATSWSWDFDGDGKEDSKEQNPVFIFDTYVSKNYTVALKISNSIHTETLAKTDYIKVKPLSEQNVALGGKVTASSSRTQNGATKAFDGNLATTWSSLPSDTQWVEIELDSIINIGRIVLHWGSYYGIQYKIEKSIDGNNWSDIVTITNGDGGTDDLILTAFDAKFVKLSASLSSQNRGYTLTEFEVYRPGITGIENNNSVPAGFNLYQNYPNPFNPETTIKYEVPSTGYVELKVFDILGSEVATLVNNEMNPGTYEVKFNTAEYNLSSGVYIYKIKAGEYVKINKMICLK